MGIVSVVVSVAFLAVAISVYLPWAHNREWRNTERGSAVKVYGGKRGESEKKLPTVVIVPGLDGCTSFFADVTPALTALGYKVILFELPLAEPPWSTEAAANRERQQQQRLDSSAKKTRQTYNEYTFDYIASELALAIPEEEDQKLAIVAESFGGFVAQRFALLYPERVHKLVFLSALLRPDLTPVVQFKATFVLPIVESIGYLFPSFAQGLFASFHVSDVVESHEPAWVKALFLKEASWAHHFSVMARCKIAIEFDGTADAPQIRFPSLIVYGESDSFTAFGAGQLHAALPHSTLSGIPGGHLPHVTHPEAFVDAVHAFLTS